MITLYAVYCAAKCQKQSNRGTDKKLASALIEYTLTQPPYATKNKERASSPVFMIGLKTATTTKKMLAAYNLNTQVDIQRYNVSTRDTQATWVTSFHPKAFAKGRAVKY